MKAGIGLVALALLWPAAASALPQVSVSVDVHVGSWRPLSPKDIAKAIENAVLEEVSRTQKLRLLKKSGGEYRLDIRGHLLDEAQTHTVSVELGPGTKTDLPSISASRTVELAKQKRGAMLTRIEKSAREAARALVDAATAPLANLSRLPGKGGIEDPFAKAKLPYQWSKVDVPRPDLGKATRDLYSRKHERRQAALRELASLALTGDTPRQALEACALDHVDKRMQLGCLQALAPLSRRSEPTRRVVIEVFRQTDDSQTRREALEQMSYFSGPSYEWVVQALLAAAADGQEAKMLKDLGDVPNLDIAIRSCLETTGKAKRRQRNLRFKCLELIEPLSYERRHALLWRFVREPNPESPYYLVGAGEREGSIGTAWNRALRALLDSMHTWDPKLGEVVWQRYQRELSSAAAGAMADWQPPSKKLAQRLVEMLKTAGNRESVRGLRRVGEADKELAKYIVTEVEELLALGTYPKSVSERSLQDLIKRLSKETKS